MATAVILFVVLLVLVVMLVFFYKKLNKEANNQYTVQNIMYKEGGVRDQMRAAALAVETRLGVQVWPHRHNEEEEMVEIHDEEGGVESGDSQHQSDTDGEDEQEEDSVDHSGSTKENEGDNSDVEGSEAEEEDRLLDNKPEENEEVGESEEKQDKELKVEGKAEASGGTGLLIDLKQFSGSAIWSEQKEDESEGGDVTAL